MSVTPDDIGLDLVPPRLPSGEESRQWWQWINDALLLIELRAAPLQVQVSDLDPRVVDLVVRRAVKSHIERPDDAVQVSSTVHVDDASRTRSATYKTGNGAVTIPDDAWELLGLVTIGENTAFTVTPYFQPDAFTDWDHLVPVTRANPWWA